MDKHILLFEFGVNLGKDVTLTLEKIHGLVFKIKRALDGYLELLEVLDGERGLSSNIQEVFLEENTAQSGNFDRGILAGDQGLSKRGRVGGEFILDVSLGALSNSVVSAEELLKCGFHYVVLVWAVSSLKLA